MPQAVRPKFVIRALPGDIIDRRRANNFAGPQFFAWCRGGWRAAGALRAWALQPKGRA